MLTIILLTAMKQGVSSRLPLQILTTAATQILFGLAIGAVLAFVVRWVLLHVDFETSGNILTTFSDYSEETDVRFIDIPVTEHHPWNGMKVRDLQLPPGTLLVFLSHPGEKIRFLMEKPYCALAMSWSWAQPPIPDKKIFT